MKLCVVIPALNEEESIEQIIQRTLQARDYIIANSDVTSVDITVVSDGSTDKTVELASKYTDQIHLIVFEKNRGYGAAIKQGWYESDADLLGFLDADGTCDPNFFVTLCNNITREKAQVTLGCRLNKNSEMPAVRRLGNTMFSILLSTISTQRVKDTASGMRVVDRAALPQLMPLPDGLHFTPAMSAQCILSKETKIIESDMPYKEREGESKLHIWKDGMRFLSVILRTFLLYRPNVLLNFVAIVSFAFALALAIRPSVFYFENGYLQEWMVYRFIVCSLMTALSFLCVSASYITERILGITIRKRGNTPVSLSSISKIYNSRFIWGFFASCIIVAIMLVWNSVLERLTTGETYEHWSRYIMSSFLLTIACMIIVTKFVSAILVLVEKRVDYLYSKEYEKYYKEEVVEEAV